jgi:hypothetical protein
LPAAGAFAEDVIRNVPQGFRRVGEGFANIARSVFGDGEAEQPRDLGIPAEQAASLRRETGLVNPDPLEAETLRNLQGGRTANPATALPRGQGFVIATDADGTRRVVRQFRGEPGEPTEQRGLRRPEARDVGRQTPQLAQAELSRDPRIAGFQALAPVEARQISQTLQRNQQIIESGTQPSAQDIASLANAQANIARVGLEEARLNVDRDQAGAERTEQLLEGRDLTRTSDRAQAVVGLSQEVARGNAAAETSLRQIITSRVVQNAPQGILSNLFNAVFGEGGDVNVGSGRFDNLVIEDGEVKQTDGRSLFDLDELEPEEQQALARLIQLDSQPANDASGLRR